MTPNKAFYNSTKWKTARLTKLSATPLCELCNLDGLVTPATSVHHMLDIDDRWMDRLDSEYLMSLCQSCHSRMEKEEVHHKMCV